MARTFFFEVSTPFQAKPFRYRGASVTVYVWLWFAVGVVRHRMTDILDVWALSVYRDRRDAAPEPSCDRTCAVCDAYPCERQEGSDE